MKRKKQPSHEVVRRVLDEEIERLGSWWDTENCWVVVEGTSRDGGMLTEIKAAYTATSVRTGLSVDRIEAIRSPTSYRAMGQPGSALSSSHEHTKRRLAEGKLERIPREEEPNPFKVYRPVVV